MHHGPELTVVAIACATLVIGAAARALSKRIGLPYTVLMLALGLGTGILLRLYAPETHFFETLRSPVSTDLILFVFLPALIFESAFALDVHAFRKNLGFVAVLAGPAMVLATLLTAGAMFGLTRVPMLGDMAWGWPAALVFGALISATDPVAVVALLRDVGAPKRLGLLIEGESLLNDGTAIVVFTVLLALLTGEAAGGIDAGSVAWRFVRVVIGGVAVGYIGGALASAWIGRTFADPLVEITVTIVLAYAAMIVAEALLHVSGVLAIVTAGIYLAGPGRNRISPEVRHFLGEFWEMLAYVANTLVFFLVGVVIAGELHGAPFGKLGVIFGAFAAIVLIRFGVTYLMRPLGNRLVGEPVGMRSAAVMAWGGLRGAVSLALALLVATHPDVDRELGRQILELTAGVVLCTIVFGGLTTGRLLAKLGFTDPSAAEALADARAHRRVLEELRVRIEQARDAPGLRRLPWLTLADRVDERLARAWAREEESRERFEAAGEGQALGALFRDAIAVERRRYRAAFSEGTLSAEALGALEQALDQHLDNVEDGRPEERAADVPRGAPLRRFSAAASRGFGRSAFALHALRYDVSRAQLEAARAVRGSMADRPEPAARAVERWYAKLERDSVYRLEDLRTHLPEVTAAVERRLAERIALNAEQAAYETLRAQGELTEAAAARAIESVKRRLKRLHFESTKVKLRETAELCRGAPLFRDLPPDAFDELAEATEERAYAEGERLFSEGDRSDAAYVIASGVVEVVRGEETVAVLGGGDVVGEMGLLTGGRRNATARAATTVEVGRIARGAFHDLLEHRPGLRERIWESLSRRALDNVLREGRLGELGSADRARLLRTAVARSYAEGDVTAPEPGLTLVVSGSVTDEDGTHGPGAIRSSHRPLTTSADTRLVSVRPRDEAPESTAPAHSAA